MIKILFIATGFAPYQFSENVVNTKLVLGLLKQGYIVDVISQKDEGKEYSVEWLDEWDVLKEITYEIKYNQGAWIVRLYDIIFCLICFRTVLGGMRWGKRALIKALCLHNNKKYDYVISRTPSDISHFVAYHFAKKTGVKWIANWNDPFSHIWPYPYESSGNFMQKKVLNYFCRKFLSLAYVNTFPSKKLQQYILKRTGNTKELKSLIIPHIGFRKVNKVKKKKKICRMCHAGNLSKERDPTNFILALDNLTKKGLIEVQVDFVGCIEQCFYDFLKGQNFLEINIIEPMSYDKSLKEMEKYDILVVIEADMQESIFLPSKVADYASLNIPILAISSLNSCLSNLLNDYGGGVFANGRSIPMIEEVVLTMYTHWEKGCLNRQYHSRNLSDYFSPENVMNLYGKIFNELV
jgi:glycosyltransferase involved in cell wall biosynthesis